MPWSVIISTMDEGITIFFVQFHIFELQVFPNAESPAQFFAVWSAYAANNEAGYDIAISYLFWIIATVVLTIAFILTVLLFVRESIVRRITPFHPAKVFGGLLICSAGLYGVAAYLYITHGVAETPIPIGMLFMAVFGVVLIFNPTENQNQTESEVQEKGSKQAK